MQVTRVVVVLFACIAVTTAFKAAPSPPPKPVWPTEFDCGFGLNIPASNTTAAIVNATSHFYYNWDKLQASVIDYPTYCLPDFYAGSQDYPCKLYFNPSGTFFSQPTAGYECCLLFPGVGSVPPEFLAGFTYSGYTSLAFDWYGVTWNTEFWVADGGFQYWTSVGTGFDIQFCDGGGLLWNFGEFNVAPQASSIFSLPSSSCNSLCKFPSEASNVNTPSGFSDPYLNLAFMQKKFQNKY